MSDKVFKINALRTPPCATVCRVTLG